MKYIKKFFDLLLFGFDCKARRNAVELGLLDFGGQGRDKYGN